MDGNIVSLTNENGEEERFVFLDMIDYRDDEFVVLVPKEDCEDTPEVIILKVENPDEDEVRYDGVTDEQTLNSVFAIFKERNKKRFNFVE